MNGPLARIVALLRPHWPRLLAASLLAAGTVAFGIGLMGSSGWLVATAARRPGIAVLQVAIVGVRFFGLGRGLLRYLERLVSHDVTLRFLARLRVHVFEAVVPAASQAGAGRRSGDVLARLVEDVDTLDRLPVRVLVPAAAALLVGGLVAVLLWPSGPMVCVAALAGLACAGLAAPVLAVRASAGAGRDLVRVRSELQATVVDGLQGMADILALGRGRDHEAAVSSLSRSLGSAGVRATRASSLGGSLAGLAADLAVVAVIAVCAAAGGVDGVRLTAITLVTIASFEAVSMLPGAFQDLVAARAAAGRVLEVAGAKPAVSRPHDPVEVPCLPLVEASGLTFEYPGGGGPAVAGVSFRLAPGCPVAVVGPSGAGKSTLVALLLRQLEFGGGELRVGGVDLRRCDPDDVRSRMAVVPQRTHLFTGSLRENLLLARPGAGEDATIDASIRARLHDVVLGWPDGYDTWVGEQGLQLSGGERQRVALARAFLKSAPILVVDEPTANLDPLTARAVFGELRRQAAERAVLVVTHRVSLVDDATEVVVLCEGRVVERGRAGELRRAGGQFRRMLDVERASLAVEELQVEELPIDPPAVDPLT